MEEIRGAGERLREARKRAKLSVEAVAKRAGFSASGVRAIENGQNGLRPDTAERLSPVVGASVAWLLTGSGEVGGEPMVRIIGRVGADNGGEVIYTTGHDTWDLVPLPPGGTSAAVALEVKGHSMRPTVDDGGLIYFEDQRNPPSPDMLSYACIVETEDGRVLFKRLLKGSAPGLYDLESHNGPTLEDVRLVWAAEPTAIIPARQARRIIRRDLAS